MKRLAVVIGLMVVFLGLSILAAEEQANLSGTW